MYNNQTKIDSISKLRESIKTLTKSQEEKQFVTTPNRRRLNNIISHEACEYKHLLSRSSMLFERIKTLNEELGDNESDLSKILESNTISNDIIKLLFIVNRLVEEIKEAPKIEIINLTKVIWEFLSYYIYNIDNKLNGNRIVREGVENLKASIDKAILLNGHINSFNELKRTYSELTNCKYLETINKFHKVNEIVAKIIKKETPEILNRKDLDELKLEAWKLGKFVECECARGNLPQNSDIKNFLKNNQIILYVDDTKISTRELRRQEQTRIVNYLIEHDSEMFNLDKFIKFLAENKIYFIQATKNRHGPIQRSPEEILKPTEEQFLDYIKEIKKDYEKEFPKLGEFSWRLNKYLCFEEKLKELEQEEEKGLVKTR